jgi:REP element-mobilizing transposase RayT
LTFLHLEGKFDDMPRKARIEYEGAVYHVMDRGDRLEAIFRDDGDRETFLKTLGEACGRCGWLVHAYVLMGNHYHLLLETPEANLSRGMRLLQGIYTIRHNARHRLRGHLFQGRYKAIVVDGEDALYFRTLGDYIHLNPVRAGLLAEGETLESYRWSSFPLHAGSPEKRPSWLKSEWILGGGGEADTTQGRSSYRNAMEKRAVDEREGEIIEDGLLKALRRGWCFGSEKFRETIMEKLQSSQEHRVSNGAIGRSHNEKEAEKLIVAALKEMGIMPGDLEKLPKGSAQKIAIATVVKQRTAVTNAWLAERLNMGAATRVSRYCGSFSERDDIKELIQKIKMSVGEN